MIRNGRAYCWGDNTYGELGNGNHRQQHPVGGSHLGVLSGVILTQITAGYYFTCALSSTGSVYCWGRNTEGELGNGATTASSTPVAVSTSGVLAGITVTQITSDGGYSECALGSNGAAYCWGKNNNGQLGNNTVSNSSVPVAVSTSGVLSGVTLTQVSSGTNSTCALSSTGAAYCWGGNTTASWATTRPPTAPCRWRCPPPGCCPGDPDPGQRGQRLRLRGRRHRGCLLLGLQRQRAARKRLHHQQQRPGGGDHQRGAVRGDGDPGQRGRQLHLRARRHRGPVLLGPERRRPARQRFHHDQQRPGGGDHGGAVRGDRDPGQRRQHGRLRGGSTGAYCWGANGSGQAGDGTTTQRNARSRCSCCHPGHRPGSPRRRGTRPRSCPGLPRPAWARHSHRLHRHRAAGRRELLHHQRWAAPSPG